MTNDQAFPDIRDGTSPRPSELMAPITPLIARNRDVAACIGLLRSDEARLVTLTGPGGVGKTRLALQVAAELRASFADGVHAISLAPIDQPELVLPAIAHLLGLSENAQQPLLTRLRRRLSDRQILLLLDNFEHVVAAAPLLIQLLSAAPRLRILATSRQALDVTGEHTLSIPPLPIPDRQIASGAERGVPLNLTALAQSPAVALFIARTKAVNADFALTARNAAAVAEICIRLDGLPLAIELAAAQSRILSPQMMLARLKQRLALLTSGPRDVPLRHQTLRNTLDWSYDLLDADQQTLFARLGVFVGGCDLEALIAVCTPPSAAADESWLMQGVATLIKSSMFYGSEGPDGEMRYGMLETVREYAVEQLSRLGEDGLVRRQHARYYCALVESLEARAASLGQKTWLDRLEQVYPNIQAALNWALAHMEHGLALRISGSIWIFWQIRGYLVQGRQSIEAALAQSEAAPTAARVKALWGAGWLACVNEDRGRGERCFIESLALAQALGDQRGIGLALHGLADGARRRQEYAHATSQLESSLPFFQSLGDREHIAWTIKNLGSLALDQADYARAVTLFAESEAIFQALGLLWPLAEVRRSMGLVAYEQGDLDRAIDCYQESLAIYEELGDDQDAALMRPSMIVIALEQDDQPRLQALCRELDWCSWAPDAQGRVLAELEALLRRRPCRPQSAISLIAAIQALRAAAGLAAAQDQGRHAERLRDAQAKLGRHEFQAAWTACRAIVQAAIFPARQTEDDPASTVGQATPPAQPAALADLTRREIEVFRLVIKGHTYARIADSLSISPHTVNAHLTSIYAKLGVKSRHEALRFALEHNLQ